MSRVSDSVTRNHSDSFYSSGIVQYANKERDQAKKALDKFLTLAPDDPHAQEAKRVLTELT
jgi:Tfp pilus assembly protein PilF